VLGWFSSEQRRERRKVRLDRKHLEARTRRFLSGYLTANEARKPQFYRAVEDASRECQPPAEEALQSSELADDQIAEATSDAAMKIVLARERQSVLTEDDRIATFVTDAYATVGVAYHRAAGVYTRDSEMQQLGTAAVHLLTMATSYMKTMKTILPDTGRSKSAAPTVQGAGKPMEARTECPPDSRPR
jgi:hypothetical protein